jgi:hypothetical protein
VRTDLRGRSIAVALLCFAALWVALPVLSRDSASLTHALAQGIAPSSSRVPADLRAAASATIGSDEARYHVRRSGTGFVATSGALTSRFGTRGVRVGAVTFRLAGASAVAPVAAGNRVEYRHGGITEWYVNGPVGLEQGFTLAKPRAVTLQLSGALVPRLHGQSISFGDVLRYGGLRVVDADGRTLPARLELAGRTLTFRVDDRGARYPVTIDPMIEEIGDVGGTITPSDGTSPGDFGVSVAVSADGNTALIGADQDNSSVGAAWAYTRTNGVWKEQQKLTPTSPVGTASFGHSVALSGDGNTALIGGYTDNGFQGAAWVATRANGVWTVNTKILPPADTNQNPSGPPPNFEATFGSAVALSADGTTAVIGAPGDGGSSLAAPVPGAGAAFVFINGANGWTEDARLLGFGEVGAAAFGSSVAIETPCGQCSQGWILVGAPSDNSGNGKAWLFNGGDGWFNPATLFPADTNGGAGFGTSVALNGDGTVALVGGPTEDPLDNGTRFGSAWVFTQASLNSWPQSAHLVPTDVSTNAGFGTSVALSSDGKTALVGGEDDDPIAESPSLVGAAWRFTNGAAWTETCKEIPSEFDVASGFGHSVALSSDGGTEFGGGPFSDTSEGGGAWSFIPGACVSDTRSNVIDDVSARVQGTVDPNGHAVTGYRIDYGTTTAYGQSIALGSLAANAAPVGVDQTLTGLQPATLYHYRIAATSAEGTAGNDRTFTTGRQLNGTTTAATSGVLASGTSRACPTATTNWGDGTPIDQATVNCTPVIISDAAAFNWTISGTHTYAAAGHYSIVVTVNGQLTIGAGAVITAPPTITGTSSQNVTSTGATVNATINPNGADTTYVVNYGTTTAYGQSTGAAAIGNSLTNQAVGQVLTGLAPNTTYHFQFVATNSAGTTNGPDTTFTTSAAAAVAAAAPPTIVGQAAPTVGSITATVSASINPNGSATTFVVQYGTTTAYGLQTASAAVGAGNALQVVTQALSGLTLSTLYHFRFVATSAAGTTAGPDATFTTAVTGGSSAQPPPGPVQGQSANVFPLSGTVLVNGQKLAIGQQIPLGSIIDATHGTVLIRTVINGVVQEMQFSGGIFQLLQLPNGTTQLVLRGGNFNICKTTKTTKKGVRSTSASAASLNAHTVRMLWGNGKGSFQTKGKYASATVRGTIYQVADRCDGTFTRVRQGIVSVLDFANNKTVNVPAGKSYLVKP